MMTVNMQFNHTKKDIELCVRCGGTGKIPNKNKLDRDDPDTLDCNRCGGSGRLQKEVTITYKPYRPLFSSERPTETYIEFDSKKLKDE
ncbi:MAG: hypothetical protein HYV29_01700 [Ignavibacteriales bacterium]|nr:hypothetical protein [Ignavibacteriales bacterium]